MIQQNVLKVGAELDSLENSAESGAELNSLENSAESWCWTGFSTPMKLTTCHFSRNSNENFSISTFSNDFDWNHYPQCDDGDQ
jgi:hypothetical protein